MGDGSWSEWSAVARIWPMELKWRDEGWGDGAFV